jgi:DNA-binding CsgD family transcriptional regulator
MQDALFRAAFHNSPAMHSIVRLTDNVIVEVNARLVITKVELKPNFDSAKPLETLGLTPREAEVLLWIAQGKSNGDIGSILGCAENTVKVHIARIFEKLGFENRNSATVRALEILSIPAAKARK